MKKEILVPVVKLFLLNEPVCFFRKARYIFWMPLLLLSACSSYLYPLGKYQKTAYKDNVKRLDENYSRFVPVKLPLDSLSAKQWTAPSPNFDVRRPNMVVIHHTAESGCGQSLRTLSNAAAQGRVSSHYLICKDGTVYQLVSELYRAWHAGLGKWGNITDVNSASIGIELDNNGNEIFSDKQIASLLVLLQSLKQRYHIPTANFVGHADIAPTRKQDPSVYFPWQQLADNGYGYWKDSVLVEPPPDFDYKTALRVIGYDIADLPAAIIAFKRHFVQNDISPQLSDDDLKVLYDIFQQYDR